MLCQSLRLKLSLDELIDYFTYVVHARAANVHTDCLVKDGLCVTGAMFLIPQRCSSALRNHYLNMQRWQVGCRQGEGPWAKVHESCLVGRI